MRTTTRVTATLSAAAVMALAAGPAMAADTTVVAQSEAEAIYLAIAGNSVTDPLGGPYRAERTESGETTEGRNEPQADLITRQTAISIGLLAQDATTGLAGNKGISEACSGIAGDGASFVGVGEDGDCLTPGNSGAELRLGKLNLRQLTQVELVGGTGTSLDTLINALPAPLREPFRQGLAQVNNRLNRFIRDIGNPGLVLALGAVQSQCEAGPGETASGSAKLTDVSASLNFPTGSPIPDATILGPLEVDPAPNTELTTDFDDVVDEIVQSVIDSLADSQFSNAQLEQALDTIRQELRDNLTESIAEQLGPLDNVISGTLNKQTTAPGEIEVTAIDAAILPAIASQTGFNAVDLRLARSQCGPGGEVAPPTIDDPDPDSPDVPRFVPAGAGGALGGTAAVGADATVPAALALLALTTFGTAVGFSSSRSRAGV